MLESSELILNPDGSVYHLGLKREDIAQTVITVGDPDRVAMISTHFDEIYFNQAKREFVTCTGRIGNKDLTVISSGIGTDNIDIVIQELDALFNIDLETRSPLEKHTELNFIRLGTSGSAHPEVQVDSLVSSHFGVGLDGLMAFYHMSNQEESLALSFDQLLEASGITAIKAYAYRFNPFVELPTTIDKGITLTCTGFYGPQGRKLRLSPRWGDALWKRLSQFEYNGVPVTNIEMETAGIFALSQELGHKCMSVNAILANRVHKTFSAEPKKTVENMILKMLDYLG